MSPLFMNLITLSKDDIQKLDEVLTFLKSNKEKYINISTYLMQKYGENHQLESLISNYLVENNFTTSKVDNHWSQMITKKGLEFNSFKDEYKRLVKVQNKQELKENLEIHNLWLDILKKHFAIISSVYVFFDILTMFLSKGKFGILSYLINII